jgi:hypothetical protein
MWDLSLNLIKNYYAAEERSEYLRGEFGKVDGWVKLFGNWLEMYGDWGGFISDNFMQDWVEENDRKKPVKPLFGNAVERTGNSRLPQNAKDMLECITNINARIIARGNRMRQALIDKKADPITDYINESNNEDAPKTVEDYLYLFINDYKFPENADSNA